MTRPRTAQCSRCPTMIAAGNVSGMCKPCGARARHADPVANAHRLAKLAEVNACPERRAKISAAMVKRWSDPAAREAAGRVLSASLAAKPDLRAAQSERMRAGLQGFDWSAHNRAIADRALAWCPVDRRDERKRLAKAFGAAEARRMIESDMAEQERRRLAAMSGLERQLEQARTRGITDKPVLRRADHAFTLGGIAGYGA